MPEALPKKSRVRKVRDWFKGKLGRTGEPKIPKITKTERLLWRRFDLGYYSDPGYAPTSEWHNKMREHLAKIFGLERPEQVMLGTGVSSIFNSFLKMLQIEQLVKKSAKVRALNFYPYYYGLEKYFNKTGIEAVNVPLKEDSLGFNTEKFMETMKKEKPELVSIAVPHNPTGQKLSGKEVQKIIDELPEESTLMIDCTLPDASQELTNAQRIKKILEEISAEKKIVFLSSVTKEFRAGAKGYRIGYAVTKNSEVEELLQGTGVFEIPVKDLKELNELLETTEGNKIARLHRKEVRESIKAYREIAERLGIEMFPSVSSFLIYRFPKDSGIDIKLVKDTLLESGVPAHALPKGGKEIGLKENEVRFFTGNQTVRKHVQRVLEFLVNVHGKQK